MLDEIRNGENGPGRTSTQRTETKDRDFNEIVVDVNKEAEEAVEDEAGEIWGEMGGGQHVSEEGLDYGFEGG